MTKKRVRVTIPRNADELIELGESIVAKHNEAVATSPLNGLDMAAFAAKVAAAKAKNVEQKKLRKDAETATEDRDGLLGKKKDQNSTTEGTVLNFVSSVRDILLGHNKGKEQHLGDFGFEVSQSGSSGSASSAPIPAPTDPTPQTPAP
ncbi:MAG: hypothetical protein KBF73_03595 [Flavobacteriales bacterium]|nr:hypothetical protein [Flavobacteriales bacterium]